MASGAAFRSCSTPRSTSPAIRSPARRPKVIRPSTAAAWTCSPPAGPWSGNACARKRGARRNLHDPATRTLPAPACRSRQRLRLDRPPCARAVAGRIGEEDDHAAGDLPVRHRLPPDPRGRRRGAGAVHLFDLLRSGVTLLACPPCQASLDADLRCEGGGSQWPAPDGIPCLRVDAEARTETVRN